MKGKLSQYILEKTRGLAATLRRDRKPAGSNCELPKQLAGYGPKKSAGRKSLSLTEFKNRWSQQKRIKRDSFVSPAKKSELKKKLRPWLAGALILIIFLVSGGPARVGYLLRDISKFKVRNLSITGCRNISVKKIEELSNITLYKTSLLEIDSEKIAARLEAQPWVKKATIERDWPSGVAIAVTEYQPEALVNVSKTAEPELFYVDKEGHTFLKVGPGLDVDYPVITGLDKVTDFAQRDEIFRDIMKFLVRAQRNNPNLPAQSVSEVHINSHAEMVIYLVDHPFPIFFGKGDVGIKFYRLLKVMESLYREKKSDTLLSGVQYIRMDYFNDKVLVAQGGSG